MGSVCRQGNHFSFPMGYGCATRPPPGRFSCDEGIFPMATAALQPTRECLDAWIQESQHAEDELRESFEALDAYQRQLDAWQRRLGEEREQLAQERQRLSEQADAAPAEGNGEQLAELQAENARLSEESGQANQLKQQLEQQLAETRAELAQQNQHWSTELARVVKLLEEQQSASGYAASDAPAAPAVIAPGSSDDPVLGSVVAQFSKLRQQRAERGAR